jgi:signal peptidase I
VSLRQQAAGVANEAQIPLPTGDVLVRLAVPGWAHSHLGQKGRARAFLGTYLALLLPGLILWGSTLGSILLGLAFTAHASSIIDVLFQRAGPFPSRIGTAGAVMLVLSLVVYAPSYWLLTHVASPLDIPRSMRPFHEGDILLCNRWAYSRSAPRPGDVVAYELPGGIHFNQDGGHIQHVLAGHSVDRILAGPGAEVRCEDGQLYVDGKLCEFRPLGETTVPSKLKLVVPPNHYAIFPSTAIAAARQVNTREAGRMWGTLIVVRSEFIHGSVYLRSYPLSRLWIIR